MQDVQYSDPTESLQATGSITSNKDRQNPTSKISQLSRDIESDFELLYLHLQQCLSKANLKLARLIAKNRTLQKQLCLIKDSELIGSTSVWCLLKENRSLRARIIDLEDSTRTFHFKATFEDPECLGWKEHPAVKQHVINVQKDFKDQSSERMMHLADIGSVVRSRWIEYTLHPGQSSSIITRGNEAAHAGFALADSLLYHPDHRHGRKDATSYIEIYGFSPQMVYQLRGCHDLMTLLSWYGSVKRWQGSKLPRSRFAKAWLFDFFEKYSKADVEFVRDLFSDGKQASLLRVLRPLFINEEIAEKRKQEDKKRSACRTA